MSLGWRVELDTNWNVLGPFPIQAREQHYLSPAFPLVNLTEPIDFSKSWSSSYADGGQVFWSKTAAAIDGTVNVSFPAIRWSSLRATEGWAALQHHSLLHTKLIVHPPADATEPVPAFRFNLVQGSYFTILPLNVSDKYVPEWYTGNIYDFRDALPRTVDLPSTPSLTEATLYDIFISGDYEIRLFGDPTTQGSDVPKLVIRFSVETETFEQPIVHEPSQDVLCDFVNGVPFGNVLGVGLRSKKGWWTVTGISALDNELIALQTLHERYTISPRQTRIIPLLVYPATESSLKFEGSELSLSLTLTSETWEERFLLIRLPIKHLPHWIHAPHQPIVGTYLYASSMPTAFVAIPPARRNRGPPAPPILALHGAGVEAIKDSFWTDALPRRDWNWYVVPQGRTSWGLDWHGSSAQDAWASVEALHDILMSCIQWHKWQIKQSAEVIVMGHSNGGQGAWYIASRYPDRVLAIVPAAAYIKSQAYIPLHMSRSNHFVDPALRGILETSLTPDDNDLHLSNIKDIPVLAIHGDSDENVPVWHTRELVGLLVGQSDPSLVHYREEPGKPHFWPTVFLTNEVTKFLDNASSYSLRDNAAPDGFTLTVVTPNECGSLHGFRIETLLVLGRLGRLHITVDNSGVATVKTSNVLSFSIQNSPRFYSMVKVGGDSFRTCFTNQIQRVYFTMSRYATHSWWELSTSDISGAGIQQAPSRLQTFLSSTGPIVIVFSTFIEQRSYSAALRIAQDLFLYHRLDSFLVREDDVEELLKAPGSVGGNLLYIGQPSSQLVRLVLGQKRTAFSNDAGRLFINDRELSDPSMAAVFIHPHPDLSQPASSMALILADNLPGLERGLRLFPLRTGVPVPSWVVTSEVADRQGAGGILGAGIWTRDWQWNDATCIYQD